MLVQHSSAGGASGGIRLGEDIRERRDTFQIWVRCCDQRHAAYGNQPPFSRLIDVPEQHSTGWPGFRRDTPRGFDERCEPGLLFQHLVVTAMSLPNRLCFIDVKGM